MDISTYLRNILAKTDGEDVCDAITDCADVLNTDELVDISTEKNIIQTHPEGKVVRKAIARLLEKLANYTPAEHKVFLVTQEEYDSITNPNPNAVYAIRNPEKCFVVALDENCEYNILGPVNVLYNAGWWANLEYQLRPNSENTRFQNYDNLGLYIGKDFGITEIEREKFERTKLAKVVIDLESYVIQERAFYKCDGLRQVYLGSGILGMMPYVFQGCHDITIVINKSEDSILGAPWGATNATVLWTG